MNFDLKDFNFEDIDNLSPDDFELFAMACLELAGWKRLHKTRVGVDARYGDGGYDIEGYREKRKWLFEVKQRSNSSVGIEALRQIKYAGDVKGVLNLALITNTYFSSKVEDEAAKFGIELIDRNTLHNIFLEKKSTIGQSFKLRAYQQKILDEILSKYRRGDSNKFLVEMATGLGKTITSIGIIKTILAELGLSNPKVLFVAHQKEILKQARLSYKSILGINKYRYSVLFDGEEVRDSDFVFSTFQTLLMQKNHKAKDYFDIIVVDECHHFPASSYSQLSKVYEPKFLLGLSATPDRQDGRDTYDFFGDINSVIGKLDLAWALKNKKLAFPKYHLLTDDIDADKLSVIRNNASLSEIDKTIFLDRKDEEIVNIVEEHILKEKIEEPKGIVFCKSIRHVKNMLNFFPPGSATAIYSGMDKDSVVSNIKNFREGKFRYILVRDLFNEGIDIPEVNFLVFLRKTASKTIWLQQLGRGLRKTPVKNYVDVFDFVGSISRLKDVSSLQRKIDRAPKEVDQESVDVLENEEKTEVLYDNKLNVSYSRSAAEIEALLERLEFKTNTKEEGILEVQRIAKELEVNIPTAVEICQNLNSISQDQLLSIFGNYLNLIQMVFPESLDISKVKDDINEIYASTFNHHVEKFSSYPSAHLLQILTQPENFPLADIAYIKDLDLDDEKKTEDNIYDFNKSVKKSISESLKCDGKEERKSKLIFKYSGLIYNLGDLKNLSIEEKYEIRREFPVDIIFIRELNKYREAS